MLLFPRWTPEQVIMNFWTKVQKFFLIGGFNFQPIWNMLVKLDDFPKDRDEQKNNIWNHLEMVVST